ncbi:MAG: outer membrane lipoprotein carrier protein LolA [Rhodothalassiaceae bacterium]
MKPIAIVLAGLAFLGAAGAAAQDLPPLDQERVQSRALPDRLDQVQAYLNRIDTLKADFVQRAPSGDVARGTLSLEKPGRLRFDYGEALPVLIVSDGQTLTFVDYDVGQVTRWPVQETPLGVLVGRDIDFNSDELSVVAQPGTLPHLTVVTAFLPDHEDMGTIEMTFSDQGEAGLTLLGWEAIDVQGYVTRIALEGIETGVRFDDETWAFEDPRRLPAQRRRRGR